MAFHPHQTLPQSREKSFILADHTFLKKAECLKTIFVQFALGLFYESQDRKIFTPVISFAHWFG